VDPFAEVDPAVLTRANLTEDLKQEAAAHEKQLRGVLAQSHSDLATSHAIRKDYAAAMGHYQDAEHWDPTVPGLMRNLGVAACIRWQHWEQAAKEFQAELALVPGDTEARYNLGSVYLQQSRVPDAAKLFQEVIAERPEHANAQYEYGEILLDRGELQQAIAHLEVAAQLSPQTDYVHDQLRSAYRKDGRIAEADHELEVYKRIKAKKRDRASTSIALQKP
jgi:tetratricopeptide (TPR) repeat protein